MTPPAKSAIAVVGCAALLLASALMADRARAPLPVQEPSPASRVDRIAEAALASRTVDRLHLFRTGDAGARISVTAPEATAMLRHALPGLLPGGVLDATVRFELGEIVVDARIVTGEFVGSAPIAAALGALPDTIGVELHGVPVVAPGRLVLRVDRARVGGVPLPTGALRMVVAAVAGHSSAGSVDAEGGALGVAWPGGLRVAAVTDDVLVLERAERFGVHEVDGSEDP